ncbi:VWA domain-containing protein [Actinosynnema pretiosum subsp. pretiosum]|uniref:VWA domain-containing protein n=1 Tax=Actinosynnema pretiosum subsp. pretiosum TaxID=103721 RepID=A0AA45L1Y9_9PSEU|nr:von Willebrand factor, type A [Actinosynnema pretiosum subsp. pretiosum]QUF01643.1 VWA domain-containing protein [Actinosynnema pretiosum subsp. pretiosum]
MSARSERPGRARRIALPLGALVGVLAAGATAVVALKATSGPDCTGTLPLKVATTPAAEAVVRGAADDYQATQPVVDGRCVQVQVEARTAADVAHELPTARINPPVMWVPDSTMWAEEAQRQSASLGAEAPALEVGEPLAGSPLVIAGPAEKLRGLGWPSTSVAWASVLAPGVEAAVSDPTTSTEGLATLAVIRARLGNADGTPNQELIGSLMRIGRNAVTVRDSFNRVGQDEGSAPLFTASEQAVLAANRAAGGLRVAASYPAEGTMMLDYPVVRIKRASDQPGTGVAASGFEQALRSAKTRERFVDAGFRTPDGQAAAGLSAERDGVGGDAVNAMPKPSPAEVSELLGTWGAVSLDSRMLAVLDVSGSMTELMGNGQTRMAAASEAALTALGMLPDTSEIGLWAFSTNKRPPNDWVELVPLGPLGEVLGSAPRRTRLQQGAKGLAALVGGGTALNDTTLAAFRRMQSTYDPEKINSVVLITDGRNDDYASITTAQLLQALESESDPARPIPLIMVGLGQEADMEALREISSATGGKAYQALEAADIRSVLLDAISQRRCRPNC